MQDVHVRPWKWSRQQQIYTRTTAAQGDVQLLGFSTNQAPPNQAPDLYINNFIHEGARF